jgi:hypothetical protein
MSRAKEKLAFGAGLLAAVLAASPAVAHAQFGDIFSAILSTITGTIGGALNEIHQIQADVLRTEQEVLYPLSLIHQAESYIATIKASYRGWMNNVFAIRINSANLLTPRNLESVFLSGRTAQIGNFNQIYTGTYGAQPAMGAAPTLNLQMMDIEDATAKDATAQAIAADQATATMLQTAQRIEDESQTTAPGTADMVSAEARTAELASMAVQHKLLAYELRERAMELAHRGTILKQSTTNAQQLHQQLLNNLGGGN